MKTHEELVSTQDGLTVTKFILLSETPLERKKTKYNSSFQGSGHQAVKEKDR